MQFSNSLSYTLVGIGLEDSPNGPKSASRKLKSGLKRTPCEFVFFPPSLSLPKTRADENVSHIPRGKALTRMDVKPRTALGTISGVNNLHDRHAAAGKVSQNRKKLLGLCSIPSS